MTKTVYCKHCDHEQRMPDDETEQECDECGEVTVHFNVNP